MLVARAMDSSVDGMSRTTRFEREMIASGFADPVMMSYSRVSWEVLARVGRVVAVVVDVDEEAFTEFTP